LTNHGASNSLIPTFQLIIQESRGNSGNSPLYLYLNSAFAGIFPKLLKIYIWTWTELLL